MSFFYELNQRMAKLAEKQDAKQIKEEVKAAAPKSRLAESLDVAEAGYSAKAGRAGKDLGKPGKNFAKIAKSAGARYGSKAAGERVAGAVLNKLRHPIESTEMDEADMEEGNDFTGERQAAIKAGKPTFSVGGKTYKVTGDTSDEKQMAEADVTGLGEEEMAEGFKEMDAWLKSREKEKGTGRFDKKKISTGTVYTRKPETFDDPETEPEATGGAPKRKGRPAGTKRAIGAKHSGRSKLASKAAIAEEGASSKEQAYNEIIELLKNSATDINPAIRNRLMRLVRTLDMPESTIAEEIPVTDRGEYDDEAGMAKDQIHTIVRHARELEQVLGAHDNLPEWVQEKMGQIKGMMTSVTDYMLSQKERGIEQDTGREGITLVPEKAVSVAQRRAAGIAHAAQKGEIPKKELRGASKEMAKMPKGELHKFAATKEKGLPKKVKEDGKPDFLDLDKDGNKTEPMKQAAKQAKTKGKDKEEKVDETTTSGSVATATAAPKASKGMQFGKGVYEGLSSKLENMIAESMNVTVNMNTDEQGQAQKSITVTATNEDADKLAELLKMAGLSGQSHAATCDACGHSPCDCEEMVDENSPDWPTKPEYTQTKQSADPISNDLLRDKSTGQTTVPVVASQLRRQASMEESVELERTLFKTWKNYKG